MECPDCDFNLTIKIRGNVYLSVQEYIGMYARLHPRIRGKIAD